MFSLSHITLNMVVFITIEQCNNAAMKEFLNTLDPLTIITYTRYALYIGGGFSLFLLLLAIAVSFWLAWRRGKYYASITFVTLAIELPSELIKTPKAIENVIAQLYSVKSRFNFYNQWWQGHYTLQTSLEVVAQDGYVQFVVRVPRKYQILIEKGIYAQYPDALISEIDDYTQEVSSKDLVSQDEENGQYEMWGTEFAMTKPSFYPIRTYMMFTDPGAKEFADPLASLFEMMSHLKRGERFWYQVVISPTRKEWQKQGVDEIKSFLGTKQKKSGGMQLLYAPILRLVAEVMRVFIETLTGSPEKKDEKKKRKVVREGDQILTMVPPEYDLIVKAIREKISRLGFLTYVRVLYIAKKEVYEKRHHAGDFQGIMRQFANPQMNSLASNIAIEVDFPQFFFPNLRAKWRKKRLLNRAKRRYGGTGVDYSSSWGPFHVESMRSILSVEEIASLWHFPIPETADQLGLMRRVLSKKVSPKQPIPEGEFELHDDEDTRTPVRIAFDPDITFFAKTNFRKLDHPFGIKRVDRRRHMYVIGKTGMGKTTCLENMIYQDIMRGEGVAVIDPHGDLVENIIECIPPQRINDTIYFNPSDQEFPIAFNMLAEEDVRYRYLMASSLVGIFKKIWADSWGPRLEYLLRNSLLTLLETRGNTILGVNRLFIDNDFRKKLVQQVQDPVVKSFWVHEYSRYNQNFQVEAVSPIQNKIGQFISIPLIRNMIGQVKSKLNFRDIIDTKKIFLVNLAKGLIGEDVSALLGATIISKLQIAAMMRANISEEERTDFYLYIDEFQNFSTESFATILSEARKYRLDLIMAHQYIEQLDEVVAAAVFGNVGTMICFGMGADDALSLEQQFTPEFIPQDLVNLGKYEILLRLMINGATSRPFSAETLSPLGVKGISQRDKIVNVTRERNAIPRERVEEKLYRWHMGDPKHDAPQENARGSYERQGDARRFDTYQKQPIRKADTSRFDERFERQPQRQRQPQFERQGDPRVPKPTYPAKSGNQTRPQQFRPRQQFPIRPRRPGLEQV